MALAFASGCSANTSATQTAAAQVTATPPTGKAPSTPSTGTPVAEPLLQATSTVAAATATARATDEEPASPPTPTATPLSIKKVVTSALATAVSSVIGSPVKHVFVIVLENEGLASVMSNSYFSGLVSRGAQLTHYYGVSHPSEPNYVAMVAGDPLVSDDGTHNLPQPNLVDLLEAKHVSWKAYLESYPGSCFAGAVAGSGQGGVYARKHNPFISFDDVRNDPQRCAKLVNSDQLNADIAAGQLPQFSFYVPNLANDGHDTGVAYAAKWLQGFLDPKLADPKFTNGTLVVVTFDETAGLFSDPASSPLYAVLLGPMIKANSTDGTAYTHYSLLRFVEDTFKLGTLHRNDEQATPFAACNFSGGC